MVTGRRVSAGLRALTLWAHGLDIERTLGPLALGPLLGYSRGTWAPGPIGPGPLYAFPMALGTLALSIVGAVLSRLHFDSPHGHAIHDLRLSTHQIQF